MKTTPRVVNSKEELISLLFELLDDNDAIEWDNDTVYSYLQAMAAWLRDCDSYYKNQRIQLDTESPSWRLIGDMLQAASVYE
jgi:hypothetical protein